jgi:hypothetical protein
MRDAVLSFADIGGGAGGGASVSAKDAMDLLLLTQYCDTRAELRDDVAAARRGGRHRDERDVDDECEGNRGGTASTSLLLVHMPEAVSELTDTARECFGSATVAGYDGVEAIDLIEL